MLQIKPGQIYINNIVNRFFIILSKPKRNKSIQQYIEKDFNYVQESLDFSILGTSILSIGVN